jgi:hypothetical protein
LASIEHNIINDQYRIENPFVSGICYHIYKYVYLYKYTYINAYYCTDLVFKNSSSIYNDLLNKADFTFFLKQLKLSNFLISEGKYLYNLIPVFIMFFEAKMYGKIGYAGRTYFLCYARISQSFASYFLCTVFTKHKTFKTYSEVTVRILFSCLLLCMGVKLGCSH